MIAPFSRYSPAKQKKHAKNGIYTWYNEHVDFSAARDFGWLNMYYRKCLGEKYPRLISRALKKYMAGIRGMQFFREFHIRELIGREPEYEKMKRAVQRMKEQEKGR